MNGLIIDMFAGGGGASVGIEMALGRPVDIAINHDPQAIMAEALVSANCPYLKVGERQPAPVIYLKKGWQVTFG